MKIGSGNYVEAVTQSTFAAFIGMLASMGVLVFYLWKTGMLRSIPKGVEMVFPLSQHIGAPAKPLVAVGDEVLVGQIIAEAGGFISANVISSVSGKVKKIEPRRVANGSMVNSIIIEDNKEYNAIEGFGEKRNYISPSTTNTSMKPCRKETDRSEEHTV